MELGFRKTQAVAVDNRWLGSSHGTSNARTVTIKTSSLEDGTSLLPAGTTGTKYVPSGLPVKEAADGTYEPLLAADLSATPPVPLAGFVLTEQEVTDGTSEVFAPLLDHGRIIAAFLPVQLDGIEDADSTGLFTWGVA